MKFLFFIMSKCRITLTHCIMITNALLDLLILYFHTQCGLELIKKIFLLVWKVFFHDNLFTKMVKFLTMTYQNMKLIDILLKLIYICVFLLLSNFCYRSRNCCGVIRLTVIVINRKKVYVYLKYFFSIQFKIA